MCIDRKIDLVCSVLDELATVGSLTTFRQRATVRHTIKGILSDYQPSNKLTIADNAVLSMRLLIDIRCHQLNQLFHNLEILAENALSDLHDQLYQQSITTK